MLADARAVSSKAARENNVTVEWKKIWSIEPRPFDPTLIALCTDAVREVTGDAPRLPSGPLHDAAEMVPHMPVVMMFAYSSNGLSHCKEEDTPAGALAQDDRSVPVAGAEDGISRTKSKSPAGRRAFKPIESWR